MNRVGLIIICTGNYHQFLQPLITSADKYFFKEEFYDIYLFTDNTDLVIDSTRGCLIATEIPHLPFPYPTLYRYKWMTENRDVFMADNLYYIDVDMLFENTVGEEILPNESGLVAVRHPGYHISKGWGSRKTHSRSMAYLNPTHWHDYYCGGFQGGTRSEYLYAADVMRIRITTDETTAAMIGYTHNNSILAEYHDETHWNYHLKHHGFKELTPEYCMVEQMELRKKWGIDNLTPRIIALQKDHKKLRT